jgi:DUF917 family protein
MLLGPENMPDLARGCSVLGAGGGGDTRVAMLASLQAMEEHGPVELVDLDDLPDDGLVMPCGYIGAPTVGLEKLGSGTEGERLRAAVEELKGKPVVALMAGEIGGGNGIEPIYWAARMGLPVVDADGMGRAFPEVPQVTMEIMGIPPGPSAMTDDRGTVISMQPISGAWSERIARQISVEWGGRAASAEYLLTAGEARTATVRGSVSGAIRIGAALSGSDDPLAALVEEVQGRILITGKLTDVDRRLTGGFVRGSVIVEGLGAEQGRLVRVEIQNENLVALEDGQVRASVPDIITVLDTQTGEAIHTETLRYGQRVSVIAFACDPIWRTPRGLELAGPRAFGYDFDYVALEELP